MLAFIERRPETDEGLGPPFQRKRKSEVGPPIFTLGAGGPMRTSIPKIFLEHFRWDASEL